MRLLFNFIKSHGKVILACFLFGTVFAAVFALYELPLAAVLYPAAICCFIGTVMALLNFGAFLNKHKRLQAAAAQIAVTDEHLPVPRGQIEEDYQAVIRALYADKLQLADRMSSRYTDLVEYYTLWAHQVKTPIAAMRLILQSSPENTAQNRELSEELQRIEQYAEMVLCYLRLDAGSTDYVIRGYDLDGIIRQAVHKYASQFIHKKITLHYEPLRRRVLTDEKWLLFVVEQVLSNALKYTKSGSISITMEQPELLCIKDTGIGIAPEDLPRIFEKGFTGCNGRDDKKASGIGLYLCRRICGNLGHKITASSAAGAGTAILIDLKSTELETE